MVKVVRALHAALFISLILVSPTQGTEPMSYIVDLYQAQKMRSWTRYLWMSDAEDQAIKAGKACGESVASLYWQAAEYASQLGDQATAKSLIKAYADSNLPLGTFGVATCLLVSAFVGYCAFKLDVKNHPLIEENRVLAVEAHVLENHIRLRNQQRRQWEQGAANQRAQQPAPIPAENQQRLPIDAVLMQQLNEAINRNERAAVHRNAQGAAAREQEEKSNQAEVRAQTSCPICTADCNATDLIVFHAPEADQQPHASCARCLRGIMQTRFICPQCRHNPTHNDLAYMSQQLRWQRLAA